MVATQASRLADLYQSDETAWLEAMARLASRGVADDIDFPHLAEYLSDMARRDKREVASRLATLMAHLLKWQFQPTKRSRSWQLTAATQRQELRRLLESRTLKNHAKDALAAAYADAVEQAAIDSGMASAAFPADCPYSLDEVVDVIDLGEPVLDESSAPPSPGTSPA